LRERSQDPPPAKLARHLTDAQAARWWQNIEQRFADERAYLRAYVRELFSNAARSSRNGIGSSRRARGVLMPAA
jgi:hypothetical protein